MSVCSNASRCSGVGKFYRVPSCGLVTSSDVWRTTNALTVALMNSECQADCLCTRLSTACFLETSVLWFTSIWNEQQQPPPPYAHMQNLVWTLKIKSLNGTSGWRIKIMSHLGIICSIDPRIFIQANCGIFDPSIGQVGQYDSKKQSCIHICITKH